MGWGCVVKELPGYDQRQHDKRMLRLDDCDFDPEIEALLARPDRAGLGKAERGGRDGAKAWDGRIGLITLKMGAARIHPSTAGTVGICFESEHEFNRH
jgi:hypothetical protein